MPLSRAGFAVGKLASRLLLGIAVLAAVFSGHGGYISPEAFVHGVRPAVGLGAVVVAVGAVAMLFVPRRRDVQELAVEPMERELVAA